MVVSMEIEDHLKGEMDTSPDKLDCNIDGDIDNNDRKKPMEGSQKMDEEEFFDAQPTPILNTDNNKVINISKGHFTDSSTDKIIHKGADLQLHVENKGQKMLPFNSNQLQELLVMQLDLIGHQQLKILQKDKQIISLKSEKEQLEAKLSRMERRISVRKRHSLDIISQDENVALTRSKVASPLVKSPSVNSLTQKKTATLSVSQCHEKVVNMAPVTITSCNDNVTFENYLQTNVTYLDPPYKKQLCKKVLRRKKVQPVSQKKVPVPPWKVLEKDCTVNPVVENDETFEDISDAAYDRRHSKPEQEERRRKRWDLQQARQQRQHEQLVQRYNEREQKSKSKSSGKSGDTHSKCPTESTVLEQLAKSTIQLHAVDVTEIVPVCAFGYPLPALAPRELDIPWFSIAKREVQMRTAKQRQVTKAKKRKGSGVNQYTKQKSKF